MTTPHFLACCISRKDPNANGDIEMSGQEIMGQKMVTRNSNQSRVLVFNTPEGSPVKGANKYARYSASKYSTSTSSASKSQSLAASRGVSNDDSFFMERENIKPYTNRQWFRVIWNNDLDNTPSNELSHSLRHGITDEMRPMIWEFLTQMEKMKKGHPKDYYKTLKSSPSPSDDQIKKDLGRTFPNHHLFKNENSRGQKALFNILRAYANHDKEIGYTQGMNFVVGKLLMIMDPEEYCASELDYYDNYEKEYEEKTFWIYYHLQVVKNCRMIYKDQFKKIHEMTKVLDEKIQDNIPEVHDIIHNSEVDVSNCFYSMFICLLLDSAPMPIAKRIIDLFLVEGESILFKVIVRALLICKNHIIDVSEKCVANLHQFLKHDVLTYVYKLHKNQLHVLFPGYDVFQ